MNRRSLLAAGAAAALAPAALAPAMGPLARPALAQPALAPPAGRVLKFVPQANLANADPVWSTVTVAANHAHMIWDQLWTFDESLTPRLQMLAGAIISEDKLTWRLALRDGLAFHDGAPVRGVDCIASLSRWMKRDGMGQRIASQLNEMRAVNDRTFEIVLKKPFPLLPMALANNCHMMPERVAKTDAFTQITDFTGSGPFRFVQNEWVSGSRAVYVKNDKYIPRNEPPSNMAGGKVVNVDRVEWIIMPDPATAAAALQTGEVDWLERPLADLIPVLNRARDVKVEDTDLLGELGIVRPNHIQPPFNAVKLRQALLAIADQKDYLAAVMGPDSPYTTQPVGIWTPGTPLATSAGMDKITGKRDLAAAKQLVAESGYKGERVVLMAPSDFPTLNALAQVTKSLCDQLGLNTEMVVNDWGSLIQRRASREPVEKGGWSIFCTSGGGFTSSNPAVYTSLWGMGDKAWFGWYASPKMEALRDAWYVAPDLASQQKLAAEMQVLAFEEVPFIPTGMWRSPIARRSNVNGILKASRPLFWNLKKA